MESLINWLMSLDTGTRTAVILVTVFVIRAIWSNR